MCGDGGWRVVKAGTWGGVEDKNRTLVGPGRKDVPRGGNGPVVSEGDT